jgi:hypothetical protein
MDAAATIECMRGLVGIAVALVIGGCATDLGINLGVTRAVSGPAPPFGDCMAESYVFIGETSLAALGLDQGVTPVPPPDAGRIGMIWVTGPIPYDAGPPGGPVEMKRSFCVEFADGSGMSAWPIDDTWQLPPAFGGVAAEDVATDGPVPLSLVVAVIGALLVIGGSILAFRRRAPIRS